MKIALFADGSSVHTEKWIAGLKLNLDCEIDLIHLNPQPVRAGVLQAIGESHVHDFAPKSIHESGGNYQYLLQAPAIRRRIRALKPEMVHTIYLTSYGFLGALCKGRAKLVHLIIGSDILVTPKRGFPFKNMARWSLARADLVMSVSRNLANAAVHDLGLPECKVLAQHYGLESWVLDYPRPAQEYTFVSNRAWMDNSNLPLIIESLSECPSEDVAVVGAPTRGNEVLGERIQRMLNAQPHLKHFPSLAHEKNIALVAASKFLISWTFTDGTPSSVMEAMAVGTIPIVSDTAPNREWVQDGVNGFLIPLADTAGIRRQLNRAITMPDAEAARMIAYNKNVVRERATLKTNMGRLVARMKILLQAGA